MEQGRRTLGAASRIVGISSCVTALVLLVGACSKDPDGKGAAKGDGEGKAAISASASAAIVVPASSASAAGQASSGAFDSCLVGSWKTTQVTLRRDQVSASGGGGISLEVQPTGATTIDFGPMSPVTADAPPTVFSYTYAGKATATLSTPSAGTYKADGVDHSKVTVTAKVSVPGAGTVELFKNTPLTELLAVGKAVAKVEDDLPLPDVPNPGQQAIDPAPIFSGTTYRCAGDKLELGGAPGSSTWQLERAR